jgi:hypothetical protein
MNRLDGGRDRDRTCDPYHVKFVIPTQALRIIGGEDPSLPKKSRIVPCAFTGNRYCEPKSTT